MINIIFNTIFALNIWTDRSLQIALTQIFKSGLTVCDGHHVVNGLMEILGSVAKPRDSFFLFLKTYVVCAQLNRLNETIYLSTQNTHFNCGQEHYYILTLNFLLL